MKIQLKSMLLLIAGSSIIFTACKKSDGLVPPDKRTTATSSNAVTTAKPANVFLNTTTLTATGIPPHVVKTGSYVASSELGTSGTYVMDIRYFGMAIHCTTTFTPAGGDEFTLYSECQMTTLTGQWRTISGTGIYTNLSGNGSIIMVPGHENCVGRIF